MARATKRGELYYFHDSEIAIQRRRAKEARRQKYKKRDGDKRGDKRKSTGKRERAEDAWLWTLPPTKPPPANAAV